MWQSAGTAALGGVTAVPLFGVANAFSQQFADKSLTMAGYDAFSSFDDKKNFSDAIFYGLPAGLTGLSLSSQAEAPLANPMRDASMFFGFVHLDRMNAMKKAVGAAVDQWVLGYEHPGANANVRDRLARAFAPKTLWRGFAAAENNAIRSMNTSYPALKNVGLADRLAYTLGFNPVELEKAYEA